MGINARGNEFLSLSLSLSHSHSLTHSLSLFHSLTHSSHLRGQKYIYIRKKLSDPRRLIPLKIRLTVPARCVVCILPTLTTTLFRALLTFLPLYPSAFSDPTLIGREHTQSRTKRFITGFIIYIKKKNKKR